MNVDSGCCGVDPILDVCAAGEEEGTYLGADDTYGSLRHSVELVDVSGGE